MSYIERLKKRKEKERKKFLEEKKKKFGNTHRREFIEEEPKVQGRIAIPNHEEEREATIEEAQKQVDEISELLKKQDPIIYDTYGKYNIVDKRKKAEKKVDNIVARIKKEKDKYSSAETNATTSTLSTYDSSYRLPINWFKVFTQLIPFILILGLGVAIFGIVTDTLEEQNIQSIDIEINNVTTNYAIENAVNFLTNNMGMVFIMLVLAFPVIIITKAFGRGGYY